MPSTVTMHGWPNSWAHAEVCDDGDWSWRTRPGHARDGLQANRYHGPRVTPGRQRWLLFAAGALFGIGLRPFSPWLTGHAEPWDADLPVWQASWLVVALAGAATGRVAGVLVPLGHAFGQMLVTLPGAWTSAFGLLGWLFIAGHAAAAVSLTVVLVAAVAALRRLRRQGSARDS